MKKIIKKMLGLDKLEESIAKAETDLAEANKRLEEAETARMAPKDRATKLKEPWVGVLETHVNKDNIRNGFFELDWNEYFVLKLKQEGYGFDGDPDEQIVDRWFRELCANVVVDGDFGGAVTTCVIDINSVKKNNQ